MFTILYLNPRVIIFQNLPVKAQTMYTFVFPN